MNKSMNTSETSMSKNLDDFKHIITSLKYFSRVIYTGNIVGIYFAYVTCSIEYVHSEKFCDSKLLHSGACYRLQTMSITEHEQVSPTQKLQLVSLELHLTFKGGCREGKDQSKKRKRLGTQNH